MATYTPTAGMDDNERALDQFNQSLRADPLYREFLQSLGVDPNRPLKLSDDQRKKADAWIRTNVGDSEGLQVDPAGNVNQDEGWSKHKKWAIPAAIAASMLIPGVGPAVMAAMKAAGGAVGLGGSGAVPGAVGGAVPNISTAAGMAGASSIAAPAGGLAGLSAISAPAIGGGLAATPLASLAGVTPGALSSSGGGLGGLATAVTGGGGGSSSALGGLDKVLKAKKYADMFGSGAEAFGASADASAANRGTRMEAAYDAELLNQAARRDYNDSVIKREQEGRIGRDSAWKAALAANHVANRGDFQAPDYLAGMTNYSFTPKAATEGEQAAAGGLRDEAMARLRGGNPIAPIEKRPDFQFDPKDMTPSTMEKVSPWLGGGLKFLGSWLGGR